MPGRARNIEIISPFSQVLCSPYIEEQICLDASRIQPSSQRYKETISDKNVALKKDLQIYTLVVHIC